VCGIFGLVDPEASGLDLGLARRSLALLEARGPDDEGWWASDGVVLGHRRLSIMDLSAAGRQPMSTPDGAITVSFNGEIYRFWELRAELEDLGHTFRSRCDTEVILLGYKQWGHAVVDRLDGMFAFAVWDAERRELFLARDRLGKKPLFWARRGTTLGFASTLRPLVSCGLVAPEILPAKLREFLFYNYVLGPQTLFRGVELLPAGSWLRYRGDEIRTGSYWDLADAKTSKPAAEPQAEFERRLAEATSVRMVSDAPVGVFLSGGVDSSLVAALARQASETPIPSFTIGFAEAGYDERPKARRVADRIGTLHHDLCLRPEELPGLLPRLAASADHLLADQAMVPLARLALEARQSVKVVLTGDGGDELLAGYATYRALSFARLYTGSVPRPLRHLLSRVSGLLPASRGKMTWPILLSRFLQATTGHVAQAHASWRTIWSHAEIDLLMRARAHHTREWEPYAARMEAGEGMGLLQSAIYADVRTWLVDSILSKVDRTTMLAGLEARSPLLDAGLVEFAFDTLLADPRNRSKRPLRQMASSFLGPELAAAPKEGFQTPFAAWFAGPLRAYLRDSVAALQQALPGVFDASVLERIESEHASGRRNHDLKLWSLVALAEWSRLFPGLTLGEDGH
jgi:asparagine synthase (glutamine-hydrolysing)